MRTLFEKRMGRAAKACRLQSHQKAKKLKKGTSWKDSANYKIKKAIKKQKKKKKLKGELIRSTPEYSEATGFQGVFKGALVKKMDERWRVQWEDGSIQDGVREEWFERIGVEPKKAGSATADSMKQ